MTTISDDHKHVFKVATDGSYDWFSCECGEQLLACDVVEMINAVGAFDVHRAVRMHLWYEQLAADHYEPDPLFEEDLEALKRYILILDPEAL